MHEDGIKEWMRTLLYVLCSKTKRWKDYEKKGIQIIGKSSKKQNKSEYLILNEYFIKDER